MLANGLGWLPSRPNALKVSTSLGWALGSWKNFRCRSPSRPGALYFGMLAVSSRLVVLLAGDSSGEPGRLKVLLAGDADAGGESSRLLVLLAGEPATAAAILKGARQRRCFLCCREAMLYQMKRSLGLKGCTCLLQASCPHCKPDVMTDERD